MISNQLYYNVLVITDNMSKWSEIGLWLCNKNSELFKCQYDETQIHIMGPFVDIRVMNHVPEMRSARFAQIVVEKKLTPIEIKRVEIAHMIGSRNDFKYEDWWIYPQEPFDRILVKG